MSEQNSNRQVQGSDRRFNQEQYDMLKRCSEKRDMKEWNKWREEHPDKRKTRDSHP